MIRIATSNRILGKASSSSLSILSACFTTRTNFSSLWVMLGELSWWVYLKTQLTRFFQSNKYSPPLEITTYAGVMTISICANVRTTIFKINDFPIRVRTIAPLWGARARVRGPVVLNSKIHIVLETADPSTSNLTPEVKEEYARPYT